MGISRFRFMLKCIRFDDVTIGEEWHRLNKVSTVRELVGYFVTHCKTSYCIGEYAILNEMLLAFRGRCSLRMYIPKKPSRYGLKIFPTIDSRTAYVTNLEIYVRSQTNGANKISNNIYLEEILQWIIGLVA